MSRPPESAKISPTAEISGTYQIDDRALAPVSATVAGSKWSLFKHDSEPVIRDIEWAERLGYERPADIRDLIKRLVSDGWLGVIRTVRKTSPKGGRPATEFYLTEGQALKVAARAETKFASAILDQLIQVFLVVKARATDVESALVATPAREPVLGASDLLAEMRAQRLEREQERRERQEEARAQSEERRLTMTVLADVSRLVVGLREQPKPAPALPPAAEWVNTANLCAQLGLSVSALNKKLRLRDKKAVDAARRWTRTDGYHWNVEAVRVLLRGPIPQRTWEPPAPAPSALPAKVDDHGLRKSIVLYVQEACKRLGKESSEDRRTIWRDLYSAYGLRSGSDPMAEARKGEKSLDVIERNKDLSTFLAICMERLPAGREHHA